MENSTRVAAVMDAPNTPAQAMTAAAAIAVGPHEPKNTVAASASGRCETASRGSVPTQTIWIRAYKMTRLPTDSRIAKGTERGALRTSIQRVWFDKEKANSCENAQRNQLGHRKSGADQGSLADATDIDPRVDECQRADGPCACKRMNQRRPQCCSVIDQQI